MRLPIILDTDPGIDDAAAIAAALPQGLQVLHAGCLYSRL